MPLKILIIGGGIAGLAAGIGLSRHKHKVTIYERGTRNLKDEIGSGVQLQPNVTKIMQEWGMLEALKEVSEENCMAEVREINGKRLALLDFSMRGSAWFVLRWVIVDLFKKFALQNGCDIREGKVESFDAQTKEVRLGDGNIVDGKQYDLIIGADGAFSKIRQALFPGSRAILTDHCTWQIILPYDVVTSDPVLRKLNDGLTNAMRIAPGRTLLSFPAPKRGIYDIEPIDMHYTLDKDPNPNVPTERIHDLSFLKAAWEEAGADEAVLKVLDTAKSAHKWRFASVEGLETWSSQDGKVVLIGDAAHAMPPYSGQGSATGIEDAVVLSELLQSSNSGDDLSPQIKLYESLRIPRTSKVQDYARSQGKKWALSDPELIEERNNKWKLLDVEAPEQVRQQVKKMFEMAKPDPEAEYGSPGHMLWLDHYDVFEVVREAIRKAERL